MEVRSRSVRAAAAQGSPGVCAMTESPMLPTRLAVPAKVPAAARTVAGDWLDRRLALVRARDRVDRELRRISLDVVGRCEHDELDPASKLLLRRVTERAIDATLDPLVTRFAEALARGIEGLPPELRYRLTRAEERRNIGWD